MVDLDFRAQDIFLWMDVPIYQIQKSEECKNMLLETSNLKRAQDLSFFLSLDIVKSAPPKPSSTALAEGNSAWEAL